MEKELLAVGGRGSGGAPNFLLIGSGIAAERRDGVEPRVAALLLR
jgi:hypothetical protein